MVHGQAIGIPFRRRKGEQAPPPPKEVAWNPTNGGAFDWYDILAGMTLPVLFWVGSLIVLIVK